MAAISRNLASAAPVPGAQHQQLQNRHFQFVFEILGESAEIEGRWKIGEFGFRDSESGKFVIRIKERIF